MRRIFAALFCFALIASSFASTKIVLGKLGQVTEPTKIYARASTGSTVYYKLKAYEYIVIRPKSDNWFQVLLQNGRYGYIQADTVAKLPFEVTTDKPVRNERFSMATTGSRGSAVAAQMALNFVGTPYVWGGNDPRSGIDCSGLVQKMFGAIGQQLPRTAAEQVNVGRPITRLEDLKPGDRLYFWENKRGKIGHTGIYLGATHDGVGWFVHSSRGHNGVNTDPLTRRWLNILVAARRS